MRNVDEPVGRGRRRAPLEAKTLLLGASLCALALTTKGAVAQLALPDITVSKPKPKRVVTRPLPAARQVTASHSAQPAGA